MICFVSSRRIRMQAVRKQLYMVFDTNCFLKYLSQVQSPFATYIALVTRCTMVPISMFSPRYLWWSDVICARRWSKIVSSVFVDQDRISWRDIVKHVIRLQVQHWVDQVPAYLKQVECDEPRRRLLLPLQVMIELDRKKDSKDSTLAYNSRCARFVCV